MSNDVRINQKLLFFLWLINEVLLLSFTIFGIQEYFNAISLVGSYTFFTQGIIIAFLLSCIFSFVFLALAYNIINHEVSIIRVILLFRKKLGWGKWLIIFISLFSTVWFFQYTFWGAVFTAPFLRLMMFISLTCWVSFLLCHDEQQWVNYQHVVAAFIITGSFWIAVLNLRIVTGFPFALSWSEGNRIWDYSIPFGRRLYDYPAEKPIFVYTDLARRLIFGIPFLLPNPSIEIVRLWIALVSFVPYAILGWLVLKPQKGKVMASILGGLWLFAFLYQGGVYAPLMIAAVLVVIACWYLPWWLSVIIIGFVSYYIQLGRINWIICTPIWCLILLCLDNSSSGGKNKESKKLISLLISWLFGSHFYLYYLFSEGYFSQDKHLIEKVVSSWFIGGVMLILISISIIYWLLHKRRFEDILKSKKTRIILLLFIILIFILSAVFFIKVIFPKFLAGQSLLWYRLLPNPTNPLGILLMLIVAVLPLAIFLFITYRQKIWTLPPRSSWLLLFSLGIFFAIGLVVSVKIGGGNNLHNMDLFMITWVLTAGIAWRNGLGNYLANVSIAPISVKVLFLVMLLLPFIRPLQEMRPLELPSVGYTLNALNQLHIEVEGARSKGEILFIDQRQLLTFDYVRAPLVVEYEKKLLQDRALSANQSYFQPFYEDLAQHRFSLIISSPLKIDYKQINESGEIFGEENNAWTKWVAEPLLRYYKPIWTFKKIGVQVLVPIDEAY